MPTCTEVPRLHTKAGPPDGRPAPARQIEQPPRPVAEEGVAAGTLVGALRAGRWSDALEAACGGLAVALGLAIPLSTTLTEILMATLVVLWVLSGRFGARYRTVRANPVLWLAVAMFALFAVATTYSTAPPREALEGLFSYRKLLYLPILATIFVRPRARLNGLRAFQLAMILTLGVSFLMWAGLVDTKWGDATDCAAFKNHINQNVLMAFFAGLSVVCARANPAWRWWYAALAAAAAFDVLFLVHGRTGYAILFTLVALLMYQRAGCRGLAMGAAVVAVMAVGAYATSSNFRQRVDTAFREAVDFYRAGRDSPDSSIGERLLFHRISLRVIQREPLLGAGTGSFRVERDRYAPGRWTPAAPNPHSSYLHVAAQTGACGLGLLLVWLAVQWRLSRRLPEPYAAIAQLVVASFAVGSLFNSLLSTTTESHFHVYFTAMCFATLAPAGDSSSAGTAAAATSDTRRADEPTTRPDEPTIA